MCPLSSKNKIVFDTSALLFSMLILDYVQDNYEILLSSLIATEFSRKEARYSIEALTDSDKEYVYKMIRRYLDKELAINYRRGRKTSHAGEFESIALAKRLNVPVVIHDNRPRQWAKMENVKSLHPIELPDTFRQKLPKEKLIELLTFHCKMKYQPACERLQKLQKTSKV